jgi:hypothetical protein
MGVQMPAALVEIGFITNPTEERDLASPRYRDRVADALARAVFAFADRYDARRGVPRPARDPEPTKSSRDAAVTQGGG